jgi:hypothetical protein
MTRMHACVRVIDDPSVCNTNDDSDIIVLMTRMSPARQVTAEAAEPGIHIRVEASRSLQTLVKLEQIRNEESPHDGPNPERSVRVTVTAAQ